MQNQDIINKTDRNKVYFLIVVIAALIGTNVFLYFKDKQQTERFATVSTEKDRLKLEVEKLEVELDKLNTINLGLSEQLKTEQGLAREKIEDLKVALQKGNLTQADLAQAQTQIKALKEFIKDYNNKISVLEKENSFLKSERDSLVLSANSASEKAEELQRANAALSNKVKIGGALKAINISLVAYKVKQSGKNVVVTRASTANKFSVNFQIYPNQLAEKGYKKIYLRIFDPAGNLLANDNNMFEADGQQMQYSNAIQISYNDDTTTHTIDWNNPKNFIKGTYNIIIYADGFVMGKSAIKLR